MLLVALAWARNIESSRSGICPAYMESSLQVDWKLG